MIRDLMIALYIRGNILVSMQRKKLNAFASGPTLRIIQELLKALGVVKPTDGQVIKLSIGTGTTQLVQMKPCVCHCQAPVDDAWLNIYVKPMAG